MAPHGKKAGGATDILLVQPCHGEETADRIFQPGLEMPISLTCLAAYLEREGLSCSILDLRLGEDGLRGLRDAMEQQQPGVIGLTAPTAAFENACRVACFLKSGWPEASVLLGGCHASALPEEILRQHPEFDCLVHGEGEKALTQFLQANRRGTPVQGILGLAYRDGDGVRLNPAQPLIPDLDSLPFTARHKIDVYRYAPNPGTRNYYRLPTTGLNASRGCPYNCQFCYKGVWGKSVRFRSPGNILDEMQLCIDQYRIHDFRFYDDVLTYSRWDLQGFCQGLLDRKMDVTWNCWSRVNDINREKLLLMKQAGCYHIKYGIEFGTEKSLKTARKGTTLDQAREAIRLTKEAGIECKGSFIFGIPGESVEDCRGTIRFAIELSPDFASFYAYDPIPGSPFFQNLAKRSRQGSLALMERRVAEKLATQAYKDFYLRRRFIRQRLAGIKKNPLREARMVMDGIRMVAVFAGRQLFRKGKTRPREVPTS